MRIAVAGGTGTVGRYVVEAADAREHEVVVLSRSSGVDLVTGAGLAAALDGVEVVVDVTNIETVNRAKATDFFTAVALHLQDGGAAAGVTRIVTLSIVGLERAFGFGYYQAKLAHEAAARQGAVAADIVRATQFHEFAAQVLRRGRRGPVAMVPRMRSQTVAARSVGRVLVEVAEGPRTGDTVEVAGPDVADMVDLARQVVARRGGGTAVMGLRVPGRTGAAMRGDALLPGPSARIVGPTFGEWLDGEDVLAVPT